MTIKVRVGHGFFLGVMRQIEGFTVQDRGTSDLKCMKCQTQSGKSY